MIEVAGSMPCLRFRLSLPCLTLAGACLGLAEDTAQEEKAFRPITTRSIAANRVSEVPEYARTIADGALIWGAEWRNRWEHREQDFRTPGLIADDALATRYLLFAKIRGDKVPFSLALEMEDARYFFSRQPINANLENTLEPLQAFVQWHLPEWNGAPVTLALGRHAFDSADRRLIARNRNRNTINAFDGLRLRLGDDDHPWEVEAFAFQPAERDPVRLDASSSASRFLGVTAYLRQLSPRLIFEPYWYWLDQTQFYGVPLRQELHTLGFHAFGLWGKNSAWDYDLSLSGQFGHFFGLTHQAWAAHAELGRTWDTAWKPRLALWYNYASGDRDPSDGYHQRFDPLFGASYAFYGFTSYCIWQNLINPAARFSFQPASRLRCELDYRANWLASKKDWWSRGAFRRDETGGSGRFIGQELEARVIWLASRHFEVDAAYACFIPGGFAKTTGDGGLSHFIQIAATVRF